MSLHWKAQKPKGAIGRNLAWQKGGLPWSQLSLSYWWEDTGRTLHLKWGCEQGCVKAGICFFAMTTLWVSVRWLHNVILKLYFSHSKSQDSDKLLLRWRTVGNKSSHCSEKQTRPLSNALAKLEPSLSTFFPFPQDRNKSGFLWKLFIPLSSEREGSKFKTYSRPF